MTARLSADENGMPTAAKLEELGIDWRPEP